MSPQTLTVMDGLYTIHQLPAGTNAPKPPARTAFFFSAQTADETTVVAAEGVEVKGSTSDAGWAILQVKGPLAFEEVGILAGISGALAKANVSIFAISTFNTDYILVKDAQLKAARAALTEAGYKVIKPRTKAEEEAPKNAFAGQAMALLEKQVPAIQKLLVEKIGPATLATLKSRTAIAMAVGGVYEFLPTAVRLVVPRELFVEFCVKNIEKLIPEQPKGKKKPKASH